jgi:hypothetical protein
MWFGLFRFRSPLLTESRLLSLPVGTEMFHFPTFPPHALCVQAWVTGHDSCRVSPFGNPRIKAQSAAPRGLSQPLTSFIGSWCQGIHRAPLLTCSQKRCSRPLCSSQGTGGHLSWVPRASEWMSFGNRDGRTCSGFAPAEARRQSPEGGNFRSLRTQQRAYESLRPVLEVPADKSAVLTMLDRCEIELVSVPPLSTPHETFARDGRPGRHRRQLLLRKEVIQPHLPVRLPCYDFVPIANPTFDGSLHKGWATGFGCYRLS